MIRVWVFGIVESWGEEDVGGDERKIASDSAGWEGFKRRLFGFGGGDDEGGWMGELLSI